ncbi:MAG: hypothetical protein VX038_04870 [Verrucomicrobiota bacterium]|nr:hypothetical protein [Verrucomicrobiota bacterium]
MKNNFPSQQVVRKILTCLVLYGLNFSLLLRNVSAATENLCQKLEQSIQGKKHGFLAGNLSYYIGGFHASWKPVEDETIGLTHPFYHDLRSRGVGLLESEISGTENTGIGNDFMGWEFYKDTRVLYGTVIVGEKEYKHPVPTQMIWRPDKMICEYQVDGILVREEKFIGENDAAASIITSSEPVTLCFEGHSFYVRHSVSSSAKISYQKENNCILILEGGTVRSKPDPNGPLRVGPCVYQGMTTALSASKDFSESFTSQVGQNGEQKYKFEIPCDSNGVTVSWAMDDNHATAIKKAREIVLQAEESLASKTDEMNQLLSEQIPQFRCSDPKFEDIYYFLWSIYLMYYIDVQKGWEMENHTQSAVNNFLGIHRYDACFQIKVGAWARDKARFAYGNVLTWKHLVENNRYRELPNGLILLSDNKGIGWHSGAYGGELAEHVLGAWQIYHHTGDRGFIRNCYQGYFRKVFWKNMVGFSMNDAEVGRVLEEMAVISGNNSDVEHWEKLINQDPKHLRLMFDQRWEANGHKDYFMGGRNGMLMTNAFWAMRSKDFPREYAERMIHSWALNKEQGFFGNFFPSAMAKKSMKIFASADDLAFGYTPDTAYFTLDGMFKQGFPKIASELTINHLENYNYHQEWEMPVAPEAYRRDLKLFGDQYSNFNAGKILLFLEGLAGLSYSVPENTLSIRDSLPLEWDWVEVDIPIADHSGWTNIRIERKKGFFGGMQKKISVEGSPLPVRIETWLDEMEASGKPSFRGAEFVEGKTTRPNSLTFYTNVSVNSCSVSIPLK